MWPVSVSFIKLYMVSLRQYIQPIHRISRHCHSVTACQFHTGNDFYKNSFLPLDSVQKDALSDSAVTSPSLYLFKAADRELQNPKS